MPYTCELCGRLSPDRSAFDRHVATEHRDARDAMCGVCGRYAGDARSLEEHVDAAHGLQIRPELAVATCKTAGTERTRERHLRYAPYAVSRTAAQRLDVVARASEKPPNRSWCSQKLCTQYYCSKSNYVHLKCRFYSLYACNTVYNFLFFLWFCTHFSHIIVINLRFLRVSRSSYCSSEIWIRTHVVYNL